MSSIDKIAPAILTRNITRVYRAATDEQRAAGAAWYADANAIANALGVAHNIPARQAAGIIAALSPLNSWGSNVSLATRLIAAGGLDRGYLGTGLRKANLILAGADPEKVLLSSKVSAFFQCIVSAGETDAVCIDRHAYAIAVGDRDADVRLNARQYGIASDAYRRAARRLSADQGATLSPAVVQAVTWVAWRRRFWAEGAWDVK